MATLLESLHQLQDIESRLHELREKIGRKKRAIQAHQKKLTELDKEVAASHEQIKVYQVAADTLDLDMRTREQDIVRLRDNLNRAKTNKEYSALLTQINTTKADNLKIEEKILGRMSALEEFKQIEDRLRAERDQQQKRLEELQREYDAFTTDVANDLDALQKTRDEAALEIPPTALEAFNRVADKHDGEGMARIYRPDQKRGDYICEGCNMSITTEIVNALLTKDELRCCQICGRILFLDELQTRQASRAS